VVPLPGRCQGILADVNVQGHVELLRLVWESAYWRELWSALALPVRTFAEVGLANNVPDTLVWQLCQQRQLALITANRNNEGADSLETAIRTSNTSESLPVFTLADPEQIRHSRAYAERVAEKLLEYLLEIDQVRGTGRLYLP
jgi:hypothetical protein